MKILLIIPYFGKLPSYTPAFFHSCKYLKKGELDILFITDDIKIHSIIIPDNVTVRITTFYEMQVSVKKISNANLYSGYKLCDYKPLYGTIFNDDIKDYEYWGYCDIDVMLGDIPSWLRKVHYKEYERVGKDGHFTIYKNTERINSSWNTHLDKCPYIYTFNFVKNTTYPCNFDEVGMNYRCKQLGIKFLEVNNVAAVSPFKDLHFHTYGNAFSLNVHPQLFVWKKGRMFLYDKIDNENMQIEEFSYMHFERRKNMPIKGELSDEILVTNEGFFPFDEKKLDFYFQTYGRLDTAEENISFSKSQKKSLRKASIKRLITEFKSTRIRAIMNIVLRSLSVYNVKI